jgi:hypothetical protein
MRPFVGSDGMSCVANLQCTSVLHLKQCILTGASDFNIGRVLLWLTIGIVRFVLVVKNQKIYLLILLEPQVSHTWSHCTLKPQGLITQSEFGDVFLRTIIISSK